MSRSRSRSLSTAGSRSRSRSRTRSRSPLGSQSRSRSRSRCRSRSQSRSRSRTPTPPPSLGDNPKDGNLWGSLELKYDEFIPADEETPTFFLAPATVELIRTRVYQAPALNKKHFNEIKKEKYMMARDINESLEPRPVPSQVISSYGGMDFSKLHGSLLHLHKSHRLTQRPIWAGVEQIQRARKYLNDAPSPQFFSPPFIGTGAPPEGFVPLQYTQDDIDRNDSSAPADPSAADFRDMHKSLGVHIKFHENATRSMKEMVGVIKEQDRMLASAKSSFEELWSRTQDYLNLSRYLETHIKDMRRSQLVKAHTKQFQDWLSNVYFKDKDRLGERDKSDEILAADYDSVIKQFNEDRKNKNVALKRQFVRNRSGGGNDEPSGSGTTNQGAGGSGQRGHYNNRGGNKGHDNKGHDNKSHKSQRNNKGHNRNNRGNNNKDNRGNNSNNDNRGNNNKDNVPKKNPKDKTQ